MLRLKLTGSGQPGRPSPPGTRRCCRCPQQRLQLGNARRAVAGLFKQSCGAEARLSGHDPRPVPAVGIAPGSCVTPLRDGPPRPAGPGCLEGGTSLCHQRGGPPPRAATGRRCKPGGWGSAGRHQYGWQKRKLMTTAREIMTESAECVREDETVLDAARAEAQAARGPGSWPRERPSPSVPMATPPRSCGP
jgi:hypothetical protein